MQSFAKYLTESSKKYLFRAKVARELSKEDLAKLRAALGKYDLDDISEPKGLPIQQKVYGFEHLSSPEVYVIDIALNYPCTPHELQAIIHETTGTTLSLILVMTPNQEVIAAPIANEAGEKTAILDKDLPKSKHPQLLADLETALAKKETKYKYEFAAKTSKASTTNDSPQGVKSPVGSKQNTIPDPYKRK